MGTNYKQHSSALSPGMNERTARSNIYCLILHAGIKKNLLCGNTSMTLYCDKEIWNSVTLNITLHKGAWDFNQAKRENIIYYLNKSMVALQITK